MYARQHKSPIVPIKNEKDAEIGSHY